MVVILKFSISGFWVGPGRIATGWTTSGSKGLMGLPEDDWPMIHQLAERCTSGQDPDVAGDPDELANASIEMAMYAIGFAGQRRAEAPQFRIGHVRDGALVQDVTPGQDMTCLIRGAQRRCSAVPVGHVQYGWHRSRGPCRRLEHLQGHR